MYFYILKMLYNFFIVNFIKKIFFYIRKTTIKLFIFLFYLITFYIYFKKSSYENNIFLWGKKIFTEHKQIKKNVWGQLTPWCFTWIQPCN